MKKNKGYILGAGVTGLSAGYASGLKIFEQNDFPGGICASYYRRPGENFLYRHEPAGHDAYRFEIGGGHWLFGATPEVCGFIRKFAKFEKYIRRSGVLFKKFDRIVPYPIQNHVYFFPEAIRKKVIREISASHSDKHEFMQKWLKGYFGKTLCDLFFYPFHELYTSGLYKKIAPQDQYKIPVDKKLIRKGFKGITPNVGYNSCFLYPDRGLDAMIRKMGAGCNIEYKKRLVKVDLTKKRIFFSDGDCIPYDYLVSTLPLNRMLEISGVKSGFRAAPYTSVLVLNIAADKNKCCPSEHWLYIPKSKCGFHRVGFYSNVSESFLPQGQSKKDGMVSIYVEKSFLPWKKPSKEEISRLKHSIVRELQDWNFIGATRIVDATWIDTAYTWEYPGSRWKSEALSFLRDFDIYQAGRYGKWKFQGIAESIIDGRAVAKELLKK